jgi:Na+/H+ antiporter NhaA
MRRHPDAHGPVRRALGPLAEFLREEAAGGVVLLCATIAGVARGQVWGAAALGGIGFTVSLFIAGLAFDDPALQDNAKVGIFAGSIASGALGTMLLIAVSGASPRPGARSRPRRPSGIRST